VVAVTNMAKCARLALFYVEIKLLTVSSYKRVSFEKKGRIFGGTGIDFCDTMEAEAKATSPAPQLANNDVNRLLVPTGNISMVRNANMAQIIPPFNVNKFISDVLDRPALWHRSYFMSRCFLEETWNELAEIHGIPSK
jgi:hypothetical protein